MTDTFIPPSIIVGSLPARAGEEDQIVWHAAVKPCRAERISVVMVAGGGEIHYIAAATRDFASHPDAWCPFAAVLPGQPLAAPAPAIYTCAQAGTLYALVHNPAATPALRLLQAPPSQLEPDLVRLGHPRIALDELHLAAEPVPWRTIALSEEALVLAGARLLLLGMLTGAALLGCLGALGLARSYVTERAIAGTLAASEAGAAQLLAQARALAQDPVARDLGALSQLYTETWRLGGTLRRYQIDHGRATWEIALPVVTADVIDALGGRILKGEEDGRTIVVNR